MFLSAKQFKSNVTCGVCRSGSVQSVSTAGVSELTLASSNTNTDPLLPHDENTEMETTSVGDSTTAENLREVRMMERPRAFSWLKAPTLALSHLRIYSC